MPPAGLPPPSPGLVIGYSYLWVQESRRGMDEGRKDRPCAIVIASRGEDGDTVVTVAAITHSQPRDPREAIEIPSDIKRRLGLDDERSWVICSELTRFVWPGPDIRPVSRGEPDRFVHGVLPRSFLIRVFERLMDLRSTRPPTVVVRSV